MNTKAGRFRWNYNEVLSMLTQLGTDALTMVNPASGQHEEFSLIERNAGYLRLRSESLSVTIVNRPLEQRIRSL